ncbi:taurine import atp-binding protein [Lasius niger]|uniref:Taurine import atp-binding protein n=1 Tax=Lasius niger TaxID=67767 RepID=A0A0J7K3P8_LASNI|nr:taurine import atp-binding protein [Lasius niger]
MACLEAKHLSLALGDRHHASPLLEDLSLRIESGQIVVILGPSGCGKTTLLNVLAGFQAPDKGQVLIDGKPAGAPDGNRGVVFQNHALLPWLNARDNIGLGLRLRGQSRGQRHAAAERWLTAVGLRGQGERPIQQLSGGQNQRLGLARALAVDPAFLLLDEPFGALDALTRERMQDLLLQLWRETHKGLFLITHSIEEALFLATDLWVMQGPPARIRQHLRPPFAHRHAEGERLRSLKNDPEFDCLRQKLLHDFLEYADG